jgi:hypothetical protein
MNIAVARAMMLPGITYASRTEKTIITIVPACTPTIEAFRPRQVRQMSKPREVPIVWKRELRVDMAAARRESMKMVTKRSGMLALMKFGMIVSILPAVAAYTAICPEVW